MSWSNSLSQESRLIMHIKKKESFCIEFFCSQVKKLELLIYPDLEIKMLSPSSLTRTPFTKLSMAWIHFLIKE